ncbi:hypothetical protein [Micromonospora sp. KC721]|uniref:hypothetical protein n=1 Tax=Micromonospora sp. KC721 TaxID=2530380 RepID=UPI00104E0E29|nr:hypothetical protein [Micromonospora sp. KC721]TDB82044.1 hypothetical protein E1182_02760 [Micromonospora sp. KC721]
MVWFGANDCYRRRHLVWTPTPHHAETRHEVIRQRQDERKRQQENEQRRAEQRRQAEAEARRQEKEWQRKIRTAEDAPRGEEQQRQWAIEAEQARQR